MIVRRFGPLIALVDSRTPEERAADLKAGPVVGSYLFRVTLRGPGEAPTVKELRELIEDALADFYYFGLDVTVRGSRIR